MMKRLRQSKGLYVLLSVFFAVMLWLYVREVEDPTGRAPIYNVPVEIVGLNVLNNQGLTVSDISADTVTIWLEAPASVQDSLNAKNVTAVVDVSRCVEGVNELEYEPSLPNNVNTAGVVTADKDPATIIVTVEKLESRTFTVEFQLQGSVAEGYQAGTAAISPETVTVSGPIEQVNRIARVVAILEATDLSQQYAGNLPLTLLDSSGEELTDLEVTLSAEYAYVVLPVVVVKEVDLTVEVIPGGGATEENATVKIEPETITVAGSQEALEALTEISLGSVDLSQVVGSRTYTLPIDLSASLENVSGITSATVTVTVEGLSTREFVVDNIRYVNEPEGCQVTIVTQERTVQVRGREEDLDLISASQLRIMADLSEYTSPGTYSVPVRVYLDSSSTVGVIGEYTITVTISR